MAELTPKREAFAKNFIENGGNATDAARKAGYKKPEQEGCRLLKNADVLAYIAEKQAKLDKLNGTDTMSLADIQKRRAMIARGEVKDSFGFTPAFSEQLKAMSDLEKAITNKEQKEAQQKAAESARAAGEYHLDLDPSDVGRVIGRKGRTISAIRTIVYSVPTEDKKVRIVIDEK